MDCDTEKLLHLIEERPPIYNFKLKEHSNRGVIETLWEEIAEEMNLPTTECRHKWTSLRNSYNRAIRDSRKNEASESKGFKRRKWYLFDAMQFLSDFVGVHRKSGRSTGDTASDTQVPGETLNKTEPLDPDLLNEPDENILQAPTRKKLPPAEKVIDPMIEFLTSQTHTSREAESTTVTFFKSLAPDVDKLSEIRKRKFKQSVMNLLYQELEEQEGT